MVKYPWLVQAILFFTGHYGMVYSMEPEITPSQSHFVPLELLPDPESPSANRLGQRYQTLRAQRERNSVSLAEHQAVASSIAFFWYLSLLYGDTYKLLHCSPVIKCSFSPDGKKLISGCADGLVMVWDRSKGTPQADARINAHSSPISSVAISDEGWAFTASIDKRSYAWNLKEKKGEQKALIPIELRDYLIKIVPKIVSYESTVMMLDVRGRVLFGKFNQSFTLTPDSVALAKRPSSDNDCLIAATNGAYILFLPREGSPFLHNIATEKREEWPQLPANITSFDASDTKRLMYAVKSGKVFFIELRREHKTASTAVELDNKISALAICPNGSFGVTGYQDGKVKIWCFESFSFVEAKLHKGAIRAIAINREGVIALASDDNTVCVYDLYAMLAKVTPQEKLLFAYLEAQRNTIVPAVILYDKEPWKKYHNQASSFVKEIIQKEYFAPSASPEQNNCSLM